MKLNINAISKRFYMKYYPDILISKEKDLDKHHGHMQEIFGTDGKHIDFFDSCVPADFKDNGEYSRFKAEIFGIGKSKFFYNEQNLFNFDHSVCKNLSDVIYYHKKISHSIGAEDEGAEYDDIYSQPFNEENFLEQTCTWVCTVDKTDEVSYFAILDTLSHAGWIFQEKSSDKVDELTNPTEVIGPDHGLIDDESGDIYYDIRNEYPTPVIESLIDEFIEDAYDISNKYTLMVKEHFAKHSTIFYKENDEDNGSHLIIIPNLDVAKNFNILDFEESVKNSNYSSPEIIDDYANSLIDLMNKEIEQKFKELNHKYENSTDIFSKVSKIKEPVLVQPEVFAMMVGADELQYPDK